MSDLFAIGGTIDILIPHDSTSGSEQKQGQLSKGSHIYLLVVVLIGSTPIQVKVNSLLCEARKMLKKYFVTVQGGETIV